MIQLQNQSIGYKLFDKGNGLWQIHTPDKVFTGSLKQVCSFSVVELGFDINELEVGVIEMDKNFHNAAEFGILKRFMWSYDEEKSMARS